ncbi:MAG TPA: CynX/NimT family MFS transporter [Moraxellaceae bacterium]|nr:CynX/NimT family MFS transporter [Moraxellaceae bacterium]
MPAKSNTSPLADELLIDAEPMEPRALHRGREALWLLLALILVAINLRPALSSLAPVLRQVQTSLDLNSTAAGLLTTLPVLCLGLFAPLATRLAQRHGTERIVLRALLFLACGILLRGLLGSIGLFAGTLMAGGSIGVIGVLLPGIVKREFPDSADIMTGVYTMALCFGAALAAGATVPLTRVFDSWPLALSFWALPAVLAAIAWRPQMRRSHPHAAIKTSNAPLWRNRLAWQVTLYMGLQSSLAYCVFGWLAVILQDRGVNTVASGLIVSASIMVQLISALGAPWLATRHRDQRPMIAIVLALTLAGLLGCLYAPADTLMIWAVILGLGQGGTFSMALSLIVLRTPDASTAARLSVMAQGIGYTLASLGPLLLGLVHEVTHGWNAAGWLFTGIVLTAFMAGMGAGRQGHVLSSQSR